VQSVSALWAATRNRQLGFGPLRDRGNAARSLSAHIGMSGGGSALDLSGNAIAAQERRSCERFYFNIFATLSFVTMSRPV
jgi:hypothetical protein